MIQRRAKECLIAAAVVQMTIGVSLTAGLIVLLRDILRDPSRWTPYYVFAWLLLGLPITVWGCFTVRWMPALWRGERREWARALTTWAGALVVAIVYAIGRRHLEICGLVAIVSLTMLALLLRGFSAVRT